MGRITLEAVTKRFGDVEVIPPLNLDINDGEFVVFVGPSGCGKSTLLRLIAGLEDTSGGRILIDGKDATDTPPAKRGLAMVFQSYALYPHMTVRDNLAFPLRSPARRHTPEEVDQRVRQVAKMVRIDHKLENRSTRLSGGEMQRIRLAAQLRSGLFGVAYVLDEPSAGLHPDDREGADAAVRAALDQANASIGEARAAIAEAATAQKTAREQLALYRSLSDPAAVSRSEVIRAEGEEAALAIARSDTGPREAARSNRQRRPSRSNADAGFVKAKPVGQGAARKPHRPASATGAPGAKPHRNRKPGPGRPQGHRHRPS